MRSVLILLLIASIFSCPFRCAVGTDCADATQTTQVVAACCDECGGHDDGPEEGAPQPVSPCDDCQCPTCICHGAIVDGDAVVLDWSYVGASWLEIKSDQQQKQQHLTSLLSVNPAPRIFGFESGRAARIGVQSFQI